MRSSALLSQFLFFGFATLGAIACGESNGVTSGVGGTTSSTPSVGGSTGGSGSNSTVGPAAGGVSVIVGATTSTGSGQGSGGAQATTGPNLNGGGTSSSTASGGTGGSSESTTAPSTSTSRGGAGVGGRTSGGTTSTGGTKTTGTTNGGASSGGTKATGGSKSVGGTTGNGGGTDALDAVIVPDPSWTCGMPEGIPSPTGGTLVFRATLKLGTTHDVGNTQFGHRRILDVKSGTLKGDRVEATVMDLGLDLELTLSNGAIELEQINILKASDGTLIFMRNCGVAAAGDKVVRVVADFEVANNKSLAWLNTGKYVGTRVVDATAGTLQLDVYDVSKVTVTEPKVQLKDPTGVPNVTWDCVSTPGTAGASVFTENVTLGSSLNVGASKRGSRNIIPITGGTTTGKVVGAILPGGGDYQLSGLDARYTLAPSDGEFILVRNCGPSNALIPVFEARADGPYAFLNQNKFVSSGPGPATNGVSITFSERK